MFLHLGSSFVSALAVRGKGRPVMSYRWMPFSGASSPFLKVLNADNDLEPKPPRQTSAIVERLGQVNPPPSQSVDGRDLLSEPQAVFNLTNTVLGVGVLSVPYAFRLSGCHPTPPHFYSFLHPCPLPNT